MNAIIPRFEFRTFAQHFGEPERLILQLPKAGDLKESEEIYILSRNTNRTNAKIRLNVLDVKELLGIEDGLEQWHPRLKIEFPVSGDQVEDEVLPLLGVRRSIRYDDLSIEEFLDKVVFSSQELVLVQVRKRRQAFVIDHCCSELSDILVNGAFIRTLSVESESKEALSHAIHMLGLVGKENISYPSALKRITGLAQWPVLPSF